IETPELRALVSVESESNQRFILTEKDRGEYTVQVSLNPSEKYRLRVKTSKGSEYLSDFVSVKNTPPIDEITWEKNEKGLNIYIDTHDPQNATRYYRWGFEETWRRTVLNSNWEYVNGAFQPRKIPTHPTCYDTHIGNPLTLFSTVKLVEDVVSKARVNFIPVGSHKLADKYSILVKQYALEKGAYEYWENMKKNTEQLGSIFDPQPSYMYGNIRSVSDPAEMVVGYFSACNVTEKRIFITAQEAKWTYSPSAQCELQEVLAADFEDTFGTGPGRLGWIPIGQIAFRPDWYAVKSIACADCGPNFIKPVWWR
ncbi:MAG TPA: DUF4249 domain-containing protein, partial [Sphingobacteriaceae bacterium]